MRDSKYMCLNKENIWKRDHRMLVNLCFIFFLVFESAFISHKLCFPLLVVYLSMGRMEDRITIQQNEVSEDGIARNVDQLSEVHIGEHHCIGLITFWRVVNTNLFYLDNILIESISYQFS